MSAGSDLGTDSPAPDISKQDIPSDVCVEVAGKDMAVSRLSRDLGVRADMRTGGRLNQWYEEKLSAYQVCMDIC